MKWVRYLPYSIVILILISSGCRSTIDIVNLKRKPEILKALGQPDVVISNKWIYYGVGDFEVTEFEFYDCCDRIMFVNATSTNNGWRRLNSFHSVMHAHFTETNKIPNKVFEATPKPSAPQN